MIQLYLLVLIIIFVVILVTIKENFKCDSDIQQVIQWTSDNDTDTYLYGCNSLYSDNNESPSRVGIKLFWNKHIVSKKTLLIVNTDDDDDTFIRDISTDKDYKEQQVKNENTNIDHPIKTYELKDNIIEGKTYFITINYINTNNNGETIIHLSLIHI